MSDGGGVIVGVDVGGTFTDVFMLDEMSGEYHVCKVASRHDDQAGAILDGLRAALGERLGADMLVHGTTVATNALLERRGAPTGVLTTRGFKDVLEMRRRDRPHTWGLRGNFVPVIPRDLRLEVDERVLADGSVLQPLVESQVVAAIEEFRAQEIEALCIFFINSHANDCNEARARAVVNSLWPELPITVSSELLPEIREFERASTASLNAYLQPLVGRYMAHLEQELARSGLARDALIVQSNGGVMSTRAAREFPVKTALSGPAAGVMAAAHIAKSAGFDNVITCDMGGTSFDVALIAAGECALAAQTSIDFGMVIRTPMIEITTIGAGGGSIAWINEAGLLQVGPESAGSSPGPACYGLGNDRPTVTDANLVLGRINPQRPIGERTHALDVSAAQAAINTHVASPLGLELMQGAEAIIRIANARMAGAIRLVSIERGYDPTHFAAMPFGGGGALHCGALIDQVGLASALVPRHPGVTSALGCVVADLRYDRVMTVNTPLARLDTQALALQMREAAQTLAALIATSTDSPIAVEHRFALDMLYVGQTHSVSVTLPSGVERGGAFLHRDVIQSAFDDAYRTLYGRVLEAQPTRVMNLKVTVIGVRPKFDLSLLRPAADASVADAERGTRPVYADGEWHEVRIFERLKLPAGASIDGPAVLEQPDATTFVDPGLTVYVDELGNLIIRRYSEAP